MTLRQPGSARQRDDGEARISGRRLDGGGSDPLSDIPGATVSGSAARLPAAADGGQAGSTARGTISGGKARRHTGARCAGCAHGAAAAAATGPGDDATVRRGRQ